MEEEQRKEKNFKWINVIELQNFKIGSRGKCVQKIIYLDFFLLERIKVSFREV